MSQLPTIFVAFAVALVVTPVVRALATAHGLLDRPNERSCHVTPTVRVGGVAILGGTAFGAFATATALPFPTLVVLVAAGFVAAVGLLDDVRGVRASLKYAAQLIAAAVVVVVATPSLELSLPTGTLVIDGVVAAVVSIVGLTAVTNAFNFIDGIDGLASGIAVVIGLALASFLGEGAMLLILIVVASTAGFALWNVHPASIFMGDVGSQFLGFILPALVLVGPGPSPTAEALLVMAPMLFDTSFTLVRRAITHKNVFRPHREHLYQRLAMAGQSPRRVANLYVALTAACSTGAIVYHEGGAEVRWLVLVTVLALLALLAVFVDRSEYRTARARVGAGR